MQNQADLAALVGSRLCHDLISPIGAIGNGVELLISDHSYNSPELMLIAESVAAANARLRFFRIAYGLAGAGQRLARSEITQVLQAISQGTRLQLFWHSDSELDRGAVKRAFLLLQCLEAALPWGGTIRIRQHSDSWELLAESERLRSTGLPWEILSRPGETTPDLTPAQVQFAMAACEISQAGLQLRFSPGEGQILLSL